MPISPLIIGLLGTAGVLAAGVCLVLAALCRRHYSRPCHRTDNGTKHVPMEAVIGADDLIVDGTLTGVRTAATPDATIMEPLRNGAPTEGSDPDIIRNQYGKYLLETEKKTFFSLRLGTEINQKTLTQTVVYSSHGGVFYCREEVRPRIYKSVRATRVQRRRRERRGMRRI